MICRRCARDRRGLACASRLAIELDALRRAPQRLGEQELVPAVGAVELDWRRSGRSRSSWRMSLSILGSSSRPLAPPCVSATSRCSSCRQRLLACRGRPCPVETVALPGGGWPGWDCPGGYWPGGRSTGSRGTAADAARAATRATSPPVASDCVRHDRRQASTAKHQARRQRWHPRRMRVCSLSHNACPRFPADASARIPRLFQGVTEARAYSHSGAVKCSGAPVLAQASRWRDRRCLFAAPGWRHIGLTAE